MAKTILSNYLNVIKHQAAFQESSLIKLESLLQIILETDLYNQPKHRVYDYLVAISDIVNTAKEINEQLVILLSSMENPMFFFHTGTVH